MSKCANPEGPGKAERPGGADAQDPDGRPPGRHGLNDESGQRAEIPSTEDHGRDSDADKREAIPPGGSSPVLPAIPGLQFVPRPGEQPVPERQPSAPVPEGPEPRPEAPGKAPDNPRSHEGRYAAGPADASVEPATTAERLSGGLAAQRWLGVVENWEYLERLYKELHADPELSNEEVRTTARIVAVLEQAGLHPKVLANGGGVICDIGEAGPDGRLGIRADYDALAMQEETGAPYASRNAGVAHACGHDIHTVVALGTALVLNQMPNPPAVRMLFQTGEENATGAKLMAEAGALDGVSHIAALHCTPELEAGLVAVKPGTINWGAHTVRVELEGPGGHGSRPGRTVNISRALGKATVALEDWVDTDPNAVMSWGEIHAGTAPNVIPRAGYATGTIRSRDHDTQAEVDARAKAILEHALEPFGVKNPVIALRRGTPPVINDKQMARRFAAAVVNGLGPAALRKSVESPGGDDLGWLMEQVPGVYAQLGIWDGKSPVQELHQPNLLPDFFRAIRAGVVTLAELAEPTLEAPAAPPSWDRIPEVTVPAGVQAALGQERPLAAS